MATASDRRDMIESLRRVLGHDPNHEFRECRLCGTTVDREVGHRCPVCGSGEIARYDL